MPLPSMTAHDVQIATVLLGQHHIDPNALDAVTRLTDITRDYLIEHDHVQSGAALVRARLAAAIVVRNLGTQPGDPETQGGVGDFAEHVGGSIPIVGGVVGPAAGAAVETGATLVHGAADVAKATISVGEFLGKLSDPTTWLRGVYVIGGSMLVLGGVFIVARELGASNVPKPTSIVTKPARLVFRKGKRK